MTELSFDKLLEIEDLWHYLAKADRNIVLYGMGDGADKILDVCEAKNIKISGVFASDEFVRNQSFRGFTVVKYADLKKKFGEMIILVSFASSRSEVLERIYALSEECELYAPDVPVFGGGLFDREYFAENFDKINKVFGMLEDEVSRKAYYNIIRYKLTGDIQLLKECETTVDEAYTTIIQPGKKSVYVDIGAYTGDTLKEYSSYAGKNITAYAFEPDAKNYTKLEASSKELDLFDIKLYNIAAWDKKEELVFYSRSGRNSAHTTSHSSAKAKIISADRVDNYVTECVDFINIDAEGSDINALVGLEKVIADSKPVISCAVYHRNEDMFEIPLYLAEKYETFRMYIRHFPYVPAWDTNFYIKSR